MKSHFRYEILFYRDSAQYNSLKLQKINFAFHLLARAVYNFMISAKCECF